MTAAGPGRPVDPRDGEVVTLRADSRISFVTLTVTDVLNFLTRPSVQK